MLKCVDFYEQSTRAKQVDERQNMKHDLVVYGVAIQDGEGNRIDPKDFYKADERQELDVEKSAELLFKTQNPHGIWLDLHEEYRNEYRLMVKVLVTTFKPEPQITRSDFHSILCEHMPSIAEDSGQAEWCAGELDKAYDDVILGKGVWSNIHGRSNTFKPKVEKKSIKELQDKLVKFFSIESLTLNESTIVHLVAMISQHSYYADKPKVEETSKISIIRAYIEGYQIGHNDTVESCYGGWEDKAEEYFEEAPKINKET